MAPELEQTLAGRRIALLGFAGPEAGDISRLLACSGAVSSTLQPADDEPGALARYDAVVLKLAGAPPHAIRMACGANLPVLALGDGDAFLSGAAGAYGWATELLIEPWRPQELLLRLFLILRPKSQRKCAARSESRVLIADDDHDVTRLLTAVLGSHGIVCATAHSGITTLQRLREIIPDLLILDIDMPQLGGFQVLEAMRSDPSLENLRVLMLTGSEATRDITRASELQVEDYIVKPLSPLMLVKRIKDLLRSNPQSRQQARTRWSSE